MYPVHRIRSFAGGARTAPPRLGRIDRRIAIRSVHRLKATARRCKRNDARVDHAGHGVAVEPRHRCRGRSESPDLVRAVASGPAQPAGRRGRMRHSSQTGCRAAAAMLDGHSRRRSARALPGPPSVRPRPARLPRRAGRDGHIRRAPAGSGTRRPTRGPARRSVLRPGEPPCGALGGCDRAWSGVAGIRRPAQLASPERLGRSRTVTPQRRGAPGRPEHRPPRWGRRLRSHRMRPTSTRAREIEARTAHSSARASPLSERIVILPERPRCG